MSASAERAEFPLEVLGEILIRAGAWSPAENQAEEEDRDGAVRVGAALDNAHHIAVGGAHRQLFLGCVPGASAAPGATA